MDSCPIFFIFLCVSLFTGLCTGFSLFVSAFVSVILCCLYAVQKSVMFRSTAAVWTVQNSCKIKEGDALLFAVHFVFVRSTVSINHPLSSGV